MEPTLNWLENANVNEPFENDGVKTHVKLYIGGEVEVFQIPENIAVEYTDKVYLYRDILSKNWVPYDEIINPAFGRVEGDD